MKLENVLYVDDEAALLKAFARLNKDKAQITTAASAAEAVQKLEKRYDAVILDGLYGDCFKLYDEIKKQGRNEFVVIYSTDPRVLERAEEEKIPIYEEKGFNGHRKILDWIAQQIEAQ